MITTMSGKPLTYSPDLKITMQVGFLIHLNFAHGKLRQPSHFEAKSKQSHLNAT